jgi:dynein heavy chain
MKQSPLWPMIIDPQRQATKFLKNLESRENEPQQQNQNQHKFMMCKPSKQLSRYLENCIRTGACLLVENVGEVLDPVLEKILEKNVYLSGGTRFINVGANSVEFSDDFRLYVVTNLANPHYTPEILTKVTLLNFTITPEALKDQLLSIVAREEEPKDEEEKLRLMYESSENKLKKKEMEDRILELLNTSQSKLLDDETLIRSLTESKKTAEEVDVRLALAKQTEDRINTNRLNFESMATFGSMVYFSILQLSNLDPMYVFSLDWFVSKQFPLLLLLMSYRIISQGNSICRQATAT